MAADWFERLTSFREEGYELTRRLLVVEDDELVSTVNGARYAVGELSLPTLAELRDRVEIPKGQRSTVRCITGEARAMHADPELEGALFQVASQFNLLEMTGPSVTPEDGVTRYSHDHTQGPACAIAAGAATIYRNYFAPVDGQRGQTRERQLDALAPLGAALSTKLGGPVSDLWTMSNGYALCSAAGLDAISGLLAASSDAERDELRGQLAIGLHRDVQVTDVLDGRRLVSQAFCSALPVAYGGGRPQAWEAFARLVLEATYEATLLAAVELLAAGESKTVLLTRVGGGVFGNDAAWIDDAITRALTIVENAGLDIRLVSRGMSTSRFEPSQSDSMDSDARWPHDALLHAWWVESGRLLAGEYPGARTPEEAAKKLQLLVDAGVDSIVDLTTPEDLLEPYQEALRTACERAGREIRIFNHPIPDMDVIDQAGYDRILAHIRHEIDSGRVVYLHCWGGKGRTSTVVGCLLIDGGLDYDAAIARIAELRAGTRKADEICPEAPSQHRLLRERAARRQGS